MSAGGSTMYEMRSEGTSVFENELRQIVRSPGSASKIGVVGLPYEFSSESKSPSIK